MVYSVKAGPKPEPPPKPQVKPLPIERARQLTKPFAGDDALDSWAAKMIADSENFQSTNRADPLAQFLPTHKR